MNENAFAFIVQARPCPTFGRPVHLRGVPPLITARYFSSCPSDSISRWTPCPPEILRLVASGPPCLVSGFRFRARLGFSIPSTFSGPRGVTPAFGYGAPHSSARGTSTLLSNALLSAHYGLFRPWAPLPYSRPRGSSTCGFSVRIGVPGSHVPNTRLTRAQATYMPDTVPLVYRFRRNLSRSLLTNHGFDIV